MEVVWKPCDFDGFSAFFPEELLCLSGSKSLDFKAGNKALSSRGEKNIFCRFFPDKNFKLNITLDCEK